MHGTGVQPKRGALWRRRQLERIAMLCRHGGGLQAIAGPFCAAVTELIGADAGMVMWFSSAGEPQGFYHQTAPAEVKDLFVTQLDADFNRTEPISAWSLVEPGGPRVGRMLAPGMQQRFEQGKICRYLCQPIGHRHLLDMSAEGGPGTLAGYFAWNPAERPFTAMEAELLGPVQPLFAQALDADPGDSRWVRVSSGTPHLIASRDGRTLLAIDAQAERILAASHLLRQNLSMTRELREAPAFLTPVAALLAGQTEVEFALPVANGRVLCRAERTRFLRADGGDEWQIFAGIELQTCVTVRQIERVADLGLTALQSGILLGALQGKARSECRARLGIGDAAFKKHLQAIFASTSIPSWSGLVAYGTEIGSPDQLF